MAAAQPSTTTIAALGHLRCDSGQKRKMKRKEQEEDRDFTQIGSSGRIGMLESIEGVLKCINSVVCFPQFPAADGRVGLRRETVTLEEQRIAGLIYSHVCTYTMLYHLEKKRTVDNSTLIKDMLAGDGRVRKGCKFVDAALWGVEPQLRACIQPLADRRRSLVGHPTPPQPSADSCTFNMLMDQALGRHKQELMAVLHTLDVIGLARGYAPPEDGKEILLYKQIRKQITSFILHAHTRDGFRKTRTSHTLASPFLLHCSPQSLCFVPPTLRLEVALEHMPDYHDIFMEFVQGATHLLSSPPTPVPVMIRELADVILAKDASLSALPARTPEPEPFVTTRSACLDRIIAILGRVKPFGEQTPTETEVRLYALLGEHVRSSLWLSTSITPANIVNRRCNVYLANASTDGDRSLLSKSDTHGECELTREQLLEQTMPYLRALKSSCMDDVPSGEECEKYHAIWKLLCPGLLVCMCSRPMPHVGEEAGQVSELELKRKVSFIYNKVLRFLAALKEEIPSVAAALHHAMLPEQQLSPQDALDWFINCKDDAAAKAKEFVDRSMSDGTMAHLELALVMLADSSYLGHFFFRLSDAICCVDVKKRMNVKNRAMVASEVQNALDILCSEQPLVK